MAVRRQSEYSIARSLHQAFQLRSGCGVLPIAAYRKHY
jgi:hypothetical protein